MNNSEQGNEAAKASPEMDAPKKPKMKYLGSIIGFFAGIAVAVPVEIFAEDMLVKFFPEYYENDASQILEAQQANFDQIKNTVSQLKRDLKSEDGKLLAKQLSSQISSALDNNTRLTKTLSSIQQENSQLRFSLSESRGFDGGSDLRIVEDTAIKVDSSTVISAINHNSYSGSTFYVSTDEGSEKIRLMPGESFNAKGSAGGNCRYAFLGYSNDVYRMSKDCKGGADRVASATPSE